MDLKTFLLNHSEKQKTYEPIEVVDWKEVGQEYRQLAIKRITSYIVEETVEVNRECTSGQGRYKPFKKSRPINEEALRDEIADVFIQWMALVSVSGTTAEEMEQAILEKLSYNSNRGDHDTRG